MTTDMTPTMQAAALLGNAEREMRSALAAAMDDAGGRALAMAIARVQEYTEAVDRYVETTDADRTDPGPGPAAEWVAWSMQAIDQLIERADRSYIGAQVLAKDADKRYQDDQAARESTLSEGIGFDPAHQVGVETQAMAAYLNLAGQIAGGLPSIISTVMVGEVG